MAPKKKAAAVKPAKAGEDATATTPSPPPETASPAPSPAPSPNSPAPSATGLPTESTPKPAKASSPKPGKKAAAADATAAAAEAASPPPPPPPPPKPEPFRYPVEPFGSRSPLLSDVAEVSSGYNLIHWCALAHSLPPPPPPPLVDNEATSAVKKERKHRRVKPVASPEPEEESIARRVRMTAEEAQQKIDEHAKAVMKMRLEQRERDQRHLEAQLRRAEEESVAIQRAELQARQNREDELRRRLQAMQERKEARELEYAISEKRMRKVLQRASPLQEKVREFEEAEKAHEAEVLAEIKSKRHGNILDGVEHVQQLLNDVKVRSKIHEEELREHWRDVAKHHNVSYQGAAYEAALEDFVKAKHIEDDKKHQRLYYHAKMAEYGRLVTKKKPLSSSPAPEEGSHPGTGGGSALSPAPTVPHGLSAEEQRRVGNEYLREAGFRRRDAPQGLRLKPLTAPEAPEPSDLLRKEEYAAAARRNQLGHEYLRQLREQGDGQRLKKPTELPIDKSSALQEIKQLRIQTNLIERKLVYGSTPPPPAVGQRRATSEVTKNRLATRDVGFADDDDDEDSYGHSHQGGDEVSYVDVVNAKLEMLKRLEYLRKHAADKTKTRW